MTNRFFSRPSLDLSANQLDRSFNFDGKQYHAYCVDLDQKLLELEQRVDRRKTRQPEPNAVLGYACNIRGAQPPISEPPSFDAAGFEQDFEIDARWI